MRREVQWKNGIKEMILISLPFFCPNWPVVIFANRIKQDFFFPVPRISLQFLRMHISFLIMTWYVCQGACWWKTGVLTELQNRFRDGHNYWQVDTVECLVQITTNFYVGIRWRKISYSSSHGIILVWGLTLKSLCLIR